MDRPKKEKTGFTELEDKYWRALRLIQTHVNEPDVVKSIVDKAIGAEEDVIPIEEPEPEGDESGKLDTSDPADENILDELTPDNTEDLYAEEDMQKHFGEEQAEGLDNLLEGLKDTPHDNRW